MGEISGMANIERDGPDPAQMKTLVKLARAGVEQALVAAFAAGRETERAANQGAVEERDELLTMLNELRAVALVDGYGEEVADRAGALVDRIQRGR